MGNYHQLKNRKNCISCRELPDKGKLVRLGDAPVGTEIFLTPECVFGEEVIEHLVSDTRVRHFTSWDLGYSEYVDVLRDSNNMVYVEDGKDDVE